MKRYTFTAPSGTDTPHTVTVVAHSEASARIDAWVQLPSGAMRLNPSEHSLQLVSESDALILTHEHPGVRSYLQWLQETSTHAQALYKLYGKRKASAEADAIWEGYYALKIKADDFAKELTRRGGLLFAFQGTTALQGGAA